MTYGIPYCTANALQAVGAIVQVGESEEERRGGSAEFETAEVMQVIRSRLTGWT